MSNTSQFVSQTVPLDLSPGQQVDVTVVFKNTGTTTWTIQQQYRLGSQSPQDNLTWGIGRVELPGDVVPGATATFKFRIKAPAAAGTYAFQWRMVQEHVEWFGATSTLLSIQVKQADTVQGNSAAFVAQSVPVRASAGASFTATVDMKNNGTTTWTRAEGYKLGSQHPQDNTTWGVGRVELPEGVTVIPGQTYRFTVVGRAPAAAGTYHFQWRMVQEYVEWFGGLSTDAVVTVDASAPAVRYHVLACGYPRYAGDGRASDINVRQPEFGYWKSEAGRLEWYAKSQATREYGERTKQLCAGAGIEVLTGWADVDDQISLKNTLSAFAEVDLASSPLRLAVMFGAQHFHGSPDSESFLTNKVTNEWAPMAKDRGRHAYITDLHGVARPVVMIWGLVKSGQEGAFGAFLKNVVRESYRKATGVSPYIIMTQHALPPSTDPHPLDAVLAQLDAVYQHECAIPPKGTTWSTSQSADATEGSFKHAITVLATRRNAAGDPIPFFPGTMIQFNRDLVPGDDHGHVEASGATEAQGRAQVKKMLDLLKRYAVTVSVEQTASGPVEHKWVTLTSLSEWPEGQTFEPSTVRGRKYLPGKGDYGHDILDMVGTMFAGKPAPSYASILGSWEKTSAEGPHYILLVHEDSRYFCTVPEDGQLLQKGTMLNYTSDHFYNVRDGESEIRTFAYSLSPGGDTLTTKTTQGFEQVYKRWHNPLVARWEKTSAGGPHYILAVQEDGHYTCTAVEDDRVIERGVMLAVSGDRFHDLRDGETTVRTFAYSLSADRNTLTTDNLKGFVQVYRRM